jgi:hypothetical protein
MTTKKKPTANRKTKPKSAKEPSAFRDHYRVISQELYDKLCSRVAADVLASMPSKSLRSLADEADKDAARFNIDDLQELKILPSISGEEYIKAARATS